MARIDPLLSYLKSQSGSDLHLVAGLEPRVRVHGAIEAVTGHSAMSGAELREMIEEIAAPAQWAEYNDCGDLDFAYGVPGVARFRANAFVQETGPSAVFRIIPEVIPNLDDLGLPKAVESLANLEEGLVLVTGPTGSGKSSTLAGIIGRINGSCAKHIVTIEDPIEFVHTNKQCFISHREVGAHAQSFAAALRSAVRQDADIIVVGELRDIETVEAALTAAEMGVLVFGTLHTNSAAKTIDRVIDVFPAERQGQARLGLAESLAAVVSQVLMRSPDGKSRCVAAEVLLGSPALGNLIREGKTAQIETVIQSGRGQGMQTMDDALKALVEAGRVAPIDAYRKASHKAAFERYLPRGTSIGA